MSTSPALKSHPSRSGGASRPGLRAALRSALPSTLWLLLGFLACSAADETGPAGVCDAGSNIFCRCENGDAGTKRCLDDGQSFGACEPCDGMREDDGGQLICESGQQLFCQCPDGQTTGKKLCIGGTSFGPCEPCDGTTATTSGVGGGGAGGGGSGGAGTQVLYAPCAQDAQCQSGSCPMGFCTKPCATVNECELGAAECVALGGGAICMPVCASQAGCQVYGCDPGTQICSQCGFTEAIDSWPVTVCSDWGAQLALVPDGTNCAEDVECNLGHLQREKVCHAFGVCATGCYQEEDCPDGAQCSSQGQIGACTFDI